MKKFGLIIFIGCLFLGVNLFAQSSAITDVSYFSLEKKVEKYNSLRNSKKQLKDTVKVSDLINKKATYSCSISSTNWNTVDINLVIMSSSSKESLVRMCEVDPDSTVKVILRSSGDNWKNKDKLTFDFYITDIEGLLTESQIAERKQQLIKKQEENKRIAEENKRVAEEKAEKRKLFIQQLIKELGGTKESFTEKGRSCEASKDFIGALNNYYQAMILAQLNEEKLPSDFTRLGELIAKGQPGYVVDDDFEFHDAWIKLINDFEKFLLKEPLYGLGISKPVQKSIDYETKTYIYEVKAGKCKSYKNAYMLYYLENGLKKAYREDWVDIDKEWPKYSYYDLEIPKRYESITKTVNQKNKNFMYNGMPFYIDAKYTTLKNLMREKNIQNNRYNGIAMLTGELLLNSMKELDSKEMNEIMAFPKHYQPAPLKGVYSFRLNIVDENGNVLAQSNQQVINEDMRNFGSMYLCNFTGISSAVKKLIESDKVSIELSEFNLKYGLFDYNEEKECIEIKSDLSKVRFSSPYKEEANVILDIDIGNNEFNKYIQWANNK